ncbi:MAG TPA: PAS domain-containing protein [Blastocatellia bacterium]|nr:PAS domain-containing protein [Blastocatellia bacterium]
MGELNHFLELALILPEPLCLVSGKGQLLGVNPALANLIGVRQERLTGKFLVDLVADP